MKKLLLSFFTIVALVISSQAQWIEQASGFTAVSRGIRYMDAVDPDIAWAVAYDGSGSAAACQDYTRTVNGGDLWTPGQIPGIPAMDLAMVSAISDQLAWIVAFPPAATTTGMGIYATADGGTTWTHQTTALFNNASSFPDCVHFFDANNGWCMGDPINSEFEIYTTTDGGTTWVAVPGANIPNPVSGEFGVVGYYCAVNDTIWFGTNKGRIYKSIDKGLNWTVAQIPGWTAIYVTPRFKNGTYGVAQDLSSTTSRLAETSDGGATWSVMTFTGNLFTNDIAYVPGSSETYIASGAAAGASGVTYSFDGGNTWNDMTSTLGVQFLAMTWLSDSVGWAGAFNTDATTGGMFKFDDVLAPAVAAFEASDTAIELGSQVTYTNLSTGNPISYLWTFEGGTPGTSNLKTPPAITYNTPGSYNVTLRATNSWGQNTLVKTDYIYVGGVGISEASESSVTIYPNPTKDVLNIEASATIQEIQILSLVGQVVLNQKVDNKTISVNVSGLKAGVYNIKVKMNDGTINKKIVVN